MPYKCARPCLGYGPRRNSCPNLVKGSEKYCPECMPWVKKATREYEQKRDESPERRFLHSMQWRAIREMKLAKDPLCEGCEKDNLTVPAILVHHIDGNELNNELENLESCCQMHHEETHKRERWGR